MVARALHHVSFPVRDLDRARHFYGEVLGLEEIARPDLGFPGAWYRAGRVEVHLLVTPPGVDVGAPPPVLTPLAAHTAFAIDDYERALATLEAHGVPVLGAGAEMGQMWVQDPDGHVIELTTARRR
jgi:catechol 2,3-dioxygenase-like lactoylglutathione lyase family enzyme